MYLVSLLEVELLEVEMRMAAANLVICSGQASVRSVSMINTTVSFLLEHYNNVFSVCLKFELSKSWLHASKVQMRLQ